MVTQHPLNFQKIGNQRHHILILKSGKAAFFIPGHANQLEASVNIQNSMMQEFIGEKVTSVSHQIPSSGPASTNVNMMFECFIAAGGAVAFVGEGTTNCPEYWLQYVLGYKQYLMDGSGDTLGPHHEYHHHFQNNWGLKDDGETSNNAVTLISYSLFTKISQRRTEDHEPDGDGWNTYTSATWALRDVVEKFHDYHLCLHAILLHCFGQDIFIQATKKQYGRENDG